MGKKEPMTGELTHKDIVTIGGIPFECHPVVLDPEYKMAPRGHYDESGEFVVDGIDIVRSI